MQQLQSDGSYNELYPKTDAYTKEEIDYKLLNQIKVGDILYTVRKEVPDNFLLCNGDIINGENYPSLLEQYENISVEGKIVASDQEVVASSAFMFFGDGVYYNGNYVFAGYNGSRYLSIAYGESLSSLAVKQIDSVKTASARMMVKKDGVCVICITPNGTGIYYAYYSSDLINWTVSTIPMYYNNTNNLIFYGVVNNNWAFVSKNSRDSQMLLFWSPDATPTTYYTSNKWKTNNYNLFSISYIDNLYMVVFYDKNNKQIKLGTFSDLNNINSDYQEVSVLTYTYTSSLNISYLRRILKNNQGYYLVWSAENTRNTNGIYIFYSEQLQENCFQFDTKYKITTTQYTTTAYDPIKSVGNCWYIFSGAFFGNKEKITNTSNNYIGWYNVKNTNYILGYNPTRLYDLSVYQFGIVLPSLSVDGVKVYLKANE